MARHARTTNVSVAQTRVEIDKLLRDFGCDRVRWSDNYTRGLMILEFTWPHDDVDYMAKISLQLPTDAELEIQAEHATTGEYLPAKHQRLRDEIGRTEFRCLLLWLKACFNAVELGIVSAETIFLPFLLGPDGKTVAEELLPRLPELMERSALALLGSGMERTTD